MPHLQTLIASTRPGRHGPIVADWFLERARAHAGFDLERIDLAEVGLPLFDEPRHPSQRAYEHEHTRAWSTIVDRADAYVIVTPEYDHGPPSALINALQFLVHEWSYKPLAFVSYGGVAGGTRSTQITCLTAITLKMMPIPEAVSVPFFQQYIEESTGRFNPGEKQEKAAATLLDELLRWSEAMRPLRD